MLNYARAHNKIIIIFFICFFNVLNNLNIQASQLGTVGSDFSSAETATPPSAYDMVEEDGLDIT